MTKIIRPQLVNLQLENLTLSTGDYSATEKYILKLEQANTAYLNDIEQRRAQGKRDHKTIVRLKNLLIRCEPELDPFEHKILLESISRMLKEGADVSTD